MGNRGSDDEAPHDATPVDPVFVESRWPIALAVSVFVGITVALRVLQPHRETLGPRWLVPGIEIAMLVMLVVERVNNGAWHRYSRFEQGEIQSPASSVGPVMA